MLASMGKPGEPWRVGFTVCVQANSLAFYPFEIGRDVCHTCIVDREIFVIKIIRILNFCVKNISPPDGSSM